MRFFNQNNPATDHDKQQPPELQLVRRLLIDVVVEPIGEEQMAVRPPTLCRSLLGVVIREVVARDFNRKTLVEIAEILVFESIAVILRVAHDKDLTAVIGYGDVGASLLRIG